MGPGWFLQGYQAQVIPAELDLASTECVVADSSQPELSEDEDGLTDEVCSDEDDFSDIVNVDFSTL